MGDCFGSIDALVKGVNRKFYEYDLEPLERVWQSLLNTYTYVFRKLGRNDFEVEHTGTMKRQQEGTLARSVEVDLEPSKTVLNW